jgi:hypothetical protein
MGTGMTMGQAAGTAAAIAVRDHLSPRAVGTERLRELQQTLLHDDCYLPWLRQDVSSETMRARLTASQGDPEPVRDGTHRPVGDDPHSWRCAPGDTLCCTLAQPTRLHQLTLIFDSGLDLNVAMSYHQPDDQLTAPPPPLPKSFRIDNWQDESWRQLYVTTDNYQRLVRIPLEGVFHALRLTLDATWGARESHLFGFYVE